MVAVLGKVGEGGEAGFLGGCALKGVEEVLGDGLRGVGEEGEGCEPDVVAFLGGGGEFESAGGGEDEDGAVEEGMDAFGAWVVIFHVEDGLNRDCRRLILLDTK